MQWEEYEQVWLISWAGNLQQNTMTVGYVCNTYSANVDVTDAERHQSCFFFFFFPIGFGNAKSLSYLGEQLILTELQKNPALAARGHTCALL